MKYLLTTDIGGTFTKLALISVDGQLREKVEIKTPRTFLKFAQLLIDYYEQHKKAYPIMGVAISSPGSVTKEGEVYGYSSVPFIHEQNMKVYFETKLRLPVTIENDANCAALAEMWNGAAEGVNTYACIVCGTGVGGAFIMDKKLYRGAHLHGGEFGYMILSRNEKTGHRQTWSELGSSSAIVSRLQQVETTEKWTGPLVFQQAENNEEAKKSLDVFFQTLAIGIFNIQYMLDPEKVLIGGGITRQPTFLSRLNVYLNELYVEKPYAEVRASVSLCHYLDQAQLFGAAYVWFEEVEGGIK
ncbi:ROK family protein [Alkalihalobacillus sp. 1P02AB]|uniref:ROK family protein n=1 Tax=Alkalihalobacillus sp. 1P02AB TaxID=3132260 RepID=UPI0039A5D2DD